MWFDNTRGSVKVFFATASMFLAGLVPVPAQRLPTFVVTDLGTLGGTGSWAYALNDRGAIVGGSFSSNGDYRAFLWTNGVMQDLGAMGGVWSEARGINNAGEITGSFRTNETASSQRALICSKSSRTTMMN